MREPKTEQLLLVEDSDDHAELAEFYIKPMEADQYGEVISEILQYWDLNQHHLTQNTEQRDA